MTTNSFGTRDRLTVDGTSYVIHRLDRVEGAQRLPYSLKVLLENLLRNEDGRLVTAQQIEALAGWKPEAVPHQEIQFTPARVLMQDFTGVPCIVDLVAMRDAIAELGGDAQRINPLIPSELVIDHSVIADVFGRANAFATNAALEFERNAERYQLLRWGQQAFADLAVVPPDTGICHQVNLEYLARVVFTRDGPDGPLAYPDTLVGTDSHTPMVNGLGVLGWGVGGIEAEAAMLGQPVYFLAPDVVGLELTGRLREGVTATDLVLTVTELLRKHKVVGKFVELIGEGTRTLSVPDRATLGNMSPENGATITFFPVDDKTIEYFRDTGRTEAEIEAFAAYYKAQGMYGVPDAADLDYTTLLRLDLASVTPSVAGPRRPQDRIELGRLGAQFTSLFSRPNAEGGFNQAPGKLAPRFAIAHEAHDQPLPEAPALQPGAERNQAEMLTNRPQLPAGHEGDAGTADVTVGHGDVLIAAITSCTNTSNPSVMLAAGLLAKKAVQAGLRVAPHIKTSLAPGSRVVTEYLDHAGLMPYLEQLGFALAGYGCTTCIGNSGDLTTQLNDAIAEHDLVCAAVLSGNRNFEARIHPNLKANFLMSPPLVVAFALAGSVLRDLTNDPIGKGKDGRDVYLRDIWPTNEEVAALVRHAMEGKAFRENYARIASDPGALWQAIEGEAGQTYAWPQSTYIAEPPYFDGFALAAPDAKAGAAPLEGARIMALFGDSITTDHISPAGSIAKAGPAGQWLIEHGVARADFNSYGSRRGHHEVMMRGTFANVRIKNLMLPAKADGSREEGGLTLLQPGGEKMPIFDAAMRYQAAGVPTVVFAGEEYGNGSSRDWAAKGTQLLGIKAVIARSFERIHRSNLVGMGVLPLQFLGADSAESLGLKGDESIDVLGLDDIRPQQELTLVIKRPDGTRRDVRVKSRIDTAIEVDYYKHGGIMPYVLRGLLAKAA